MHDSIYVPCSQGPSLKWLTHAVLYWDSVGILTTGDLNDNPAKNHDHIDEFVQTGLVTRIPTEKNIEDIGDLSIHFVKYIDSLNRQLSLRQRALLQGDLIPMRESMLGNIGEMFVERRLAIRPKDLSIPGFYVERKTALQYLFYLAFVLGKTGDTKSTPIADRFDWFQKKSDIVLDSTSQEAMTFQFLKDIFPVPQAPLSATQIVRFKQRHGAQLLRFRRRIEKDLMILSMLKEPDAIEDYNNEVIKSTKEEKEEIHALMEKSGFGTIRGEKIVAVKAPSNGAARSGLISAIRNALPNQEIGVDTAPMAYVVFPLNDWNLTIPPQKMNNTTARKKPNESDAQSKLKMMLEPMITEMFNDTLAHHVDSVILKLMRQYLEEKQTGMPILTSKAQVEVTIMSKKKIRKSFHGQGGYLGYGRHHEAVMHLSSLDCAAIQTGQDSVTYSGTFSMDIDDTAVGRPISFLDQAEFIQIGFSPIPPKSRVMEGKAVVIINNAIRYEYEIPPQIMASNFILITNLENSRPIGLSTNVNGSLVASR